ncbi:MAG: DUF2937 family protein [Proteobacteria bacterium]|nr:DUF2937 family protein [Pseudomonadota bacterium]
MTWLLRRLDSFVSTLFAALAGIAASQFLSFVQQYRQRLGGHLAEAQFNVRQTMDGPVYRGMDAEAQRQLLGPLVGRVNDLNDANTALATARPWELPWAFLQAADWEIASGALADFQPALPVDAASLLYTAAGLLLGWAVYDLLKWPFRRRRSADAGAA